MSPTTLSRVPAEYHEPTALSRSSLEVPIIVKRSQELRADAVPTTKRRSNWKAAVQVAAVLAAIVATTAAQPWKYLEADPVTAMAAPAMEPARSVKVDQPKPAATADVVLPATIRPWQTTTLHARVSGYLTTWNKNLGATVKAGEVLATIETPELDQEVAQGEALAQESIAAAVQAQAERQEAEADLKVAEAQLLRARADAELAASHLVRRERLLSTQTISREEYDTFQKAVAARNADVSAAESDVARRRNNLATRAAIITARQATASSRQSNVERLKELQGFKRIVAPFDGVVTSRTAEVGMLVTAGKESLFTIEDMSRVRVQVNVPQAYSAQTLPGVPATVCVPESSANSVAVTVTRIAESVDSSNRTMLAEIEIENGSRRFQPGSYAQVTLATSQNHAEWTIPTNTLQMRVEGPHVAVVTDQNQVELRSVSLGRDLGNRVIVVNGIRGNERLIVNPGEDLRNGEAVQVDGLLASHSNVPEHAVSAE